MRLRKLLAILLVVAMTVAALSACKGKDKPDDQGTKTENNSGNTGNTGNTSGDTTGGQNNPDEAAAAFPAMVVNDNPAINGGTLKVALVASSAFAGVLNPVFYEDNFDNQILTWFTEPIISYDENFVADQDGAATYTYDVDAKTITITVRDGVKWHDGAPVTADDLLFAYEVICHGDYQGFRYGESEINVEGAEEYRTGAASTISGLTLSEDKMSLTIKFKEFYPSILVGGFWTNPIPRHYFEGIAIKDMAAHDKSRVNPIGFGPFKVKSIVPGEAVEFERFDDYWRGTPKLEGVILTVVNPDLVPAAMQDGRFDVAEFSVQQYPDYKNPTNYQYIGEVQTVFSYTGFKLGTWNVDNNENIVNNEAKMNNVNLRQAIGYAIDNDTLAATLYNGLRFRATTVITPRHGSYQHKELVGYTYDPEKSKQLLDEAGYVDVDGDGFREDPSGNKFTITWAAMEGQGQDIYAQFKLQAWEEVGLRVELYNGRLTEFNAFYEAVEADDPAIDMYDAAWSTGYDPNPAALWGRFSPANYTRYASASFDTIINAIASDQAWDNDFLTEQYRAWQEAFYNEAPAIPTLWRMRLQAVNNRVKNYTNVATDIEQTLHLIEVTAEDTIK